MIIPILAVVAILTYLAWIRIEPLAWRVPLGLISGTVFVALVMLLLVNFDRHYGMEKVTKTETHQIYSAVGDKLPIGVLVTKELGTKADNYVLVYADKKDAKATPHFVPDTKHMVQAVKKSATYREANVAQATVTTTTTRWEWRNKVFEFLLGFGGEGGTVAKQSSVVTMPKSSWLAVTDKQAKQLTKLQGAQDTAQQQALQQVVAEQVMAYREVNPMATPAELAKVEQKVTTETTVAAVKKMLAEN